MNKAAAELGVELIIYEVRSDDEIAAIADNIPAEADAVFLVRSGSITSHAASIVDAATALGIPVGSTVVELGEEGVVVAYGATYYSLGKQATHLADQIARGASAADLPIETGDPFLMVNLHTANLIGLPISDEILQQAETLIRDYADGS